MNEKLYLEDEENLGTQVDESYEQVYCRPDTLTDVPFHYCPGCGHSVVHKVLMEVVEELGIQEEIVGVAPVGCSVFAYHYMNIDMQEAAHGRASAVATGIKRVLPDKYVFSYQGDLSVKSQIGAGTEFLIRLPRDMGEEVYEDGTR